LIFAPQDVESHKAELKQNTGTWRLVSPVLRWEKIPWGYYACYKW